MPVELKWLPAGTTGFLSFPEQKAHLIDELRNRFNVSSDDIQKAEQHGDLLIFSPESLPPELCGTNPSVVPYWCRTALLEPFRMTFGSIGEAAGALKQIQRSWAFYGTVAFRRSALIQEKLPYINLKPRQFPVSLPKSPMGIFTLLDNNTMIASAATTSLFPCGILEFQENHDEPPSRAYLKFQEALTNFALIFGQMPRHGERCLDAGACPGGWTWVLRLLGCNVVAVDRNELAPHLMEDDSVTFMRHDAFTLPPEDLGEFDWVCSDVICYPERLLKWILRWLESGLCRNMICTIKMQGATDWGLIADFASIPNSRVMHMNYNKHELTWLHSSSHDT